MSNPPSLWSQLPHDLVEIEARGLLPDGVFLEALEPLRHQGLCRHEHEGAVRLPVAVQKRMRAALEGIGAQVVEQWTAELLIVPEPDVEAFVILLDERDLPVKDADGEE